MSLFEALNEGYVPKKAARPKLTASEVNEIRELWAGQRWSQQEIADRFGVCQPQISKIVNGIQWKATDR